MVTQRLLASGFFFDILSLRPKRFCRRRHSSCRPTWPLFHKCHLISSCFFFEDRPVSMVVAHPAGSQVCFFSGELEGKGEGAQNLVLTP